MQLVFFFMLLQSMAIYASETIPNNFTLTLDRQYVFEEKENVLITDIAKFDVNANGTISIISSKDGSCKLYDTTGILLWHYLPDWKLIDTFLAVLPEEHDMMKRKATRASEIFDSKLLIERQIELHGEINEEVWSRFLRSYKHSVEGINYNKYLNNYFLILRIEFSHIRFSIILVLLGY